MENTSAPEKTTVIAEANPSTTPENVTTAPVSNNSVPLKNKPSQKQILVIAGIVVLIVVAIIAGVVFLKPNSSSTTTNNSNTSKTDSPSQTTITTPAEVGLDKAYTGILAGMPADVKLPESSVKTSVRKYLAKRYYIQSDTDTDSAYNFFIAEMNKNGWTLKNESKKKSTTKEIADKNEYNLSYKKGQRSVNIYLRVSYEKDSEGKSNYNAVSVESNITDTDLDSKYEIVGSDGVFKGLPKDMPIYSVQGKKTIDDQGLLFLANYINVSVESTEEYTALRDKTKAMLLNSGWSLKKEEPSSSFVDGTKNPYSYELTFTKDDLTLQSEFYFNESKFDEKKKSKLTFTVTNE